MKKVFIVIVSLFVWGALYAQDEVTLPAQDSVTHKIERLEDSLQKMQQKANLHKKEIKHALHNVRLQLQALENQRDKDVESLQRTLAMLDTQADALKGELVVTKQELNKVDTSSHHKIKKRSVYGVLIAWILLAVIAITYLWTKRKFSRSEIDLGKVKDAQTTLREESLRLDQKLIDLLERQVVEEKAAPPAAVHDEVDHSLIKKVADEIARIELNLSRMDKNIRGYKQLQRGIERIKNRFLAKGYEIVDMLGKPYVEGMKAVASFITDESLPKGSQVITGVTKPQINYKGELLQAAEITVSQNI